MLCFPFDIVDDFWLRGKGGPATSARHSPNENNLCKFTNESKCILPNYVENVLEKGPKFRAPHPLNDNFIEKTKLQLEMFTYKLRWSEKMAGSATADNKIPFKRNTVTLPPNMNEDLEQQLTCLKRDILKVTEVEAKKVKKNEKYRRLPSPKI